jgi:hypothetical protein
MDSTVMQMATMNRGPKNLLMIVLDKEEKMWVAVLNLIINNNNDNVRKFKLCRNKQFSMGLALGSGSEDHQHCCCCYCVPIQVLKPNRPVRVTPSRRKSWIGLASSNRSTIKHRPL